MLSDIQRKLVEDNMKLVFLCLYKNHFPLELQDLGYIGLCKAALTFDETLNIKFTTYAYKCIWSAILSNQRKPHKEELTLGKILSLDYPILGKDGMDLQLQDIIKDARPNLSIFFNNYLKFIKTIKKEHHRNIMELYYLGYTHEETIKILNLSFKQPYVSRLIRRYNKQFINKYYKGVTPKDIMKGDY